MPSLETIAKFQSESLDDTDPYASVWQTILDKQRQAAAAAADVVEHGNPNDDNNSNTSYKCQTRLWGGRGLGGRGRSRVTFQPTDIVLEDIRLQYLNSNTSSKSKTNKSSTTTIIKKKSSSSSRSSKKSSSSNPMILDGATLKLLSGHFYGLIGQNGSGKSTLLHRINDQKIPGWNIQWTSLYIPPSLSLEEQTLTPMELFRTKLNDCHQTSRSAIVSMISDLESQLEQLDLEIDPDATEVICERISKLEETLESRDTDDCRTFQDFLQQQDGLTVDDIIHNPLHQLTSGQQKDVLLLVATMCSRYVTILLLDEPTNDCDVRSLLRLRTMLLESITCTVVMVCHDVDLINDVVTDIIELKSSKLWYYPGNYDSYRLMKEQTETHQMKQVLAVEKKRDQLYTTLQNLKEKPTPKRGGAKKKAKSLAAQRKKIEWHEKKDVTELSTSLTISDNHDGAMVLPPKRMGSGGGLVTTTQRIRLTQILKSVPDKAVQFIFPHIPSQWNEPLIVAYDVGYKDPKEVKRQGNGMAVVRSSEKRGDTEDTSTNGITSINNHDNDNDQNENDVSTASKNNTDAFQIMKRDNFVFDCVDMSIEEGSLNCILGPTSLSLYLLKILAKQFSPTEGTVHHASGIAIGYVDSSSIGRLKEEVESTSTTALDYLVEKHPTISHEDLRAHLSSFGLSSTNHQTKTPLCCLSGGEMFRFVLAVQVVDKPPVLCLDQPTAHLDVESVQALSYGLQQWNGTLIMVCHDASFLRSLDGVKCVVIIPEEGKVRRIVQEEGVGSMDSYLRSLR